MIPGRRSLSFVEAAVTFQFVLSVWFSSSCFNGRY